MDSYLQIAQTGLRSARRPMGAKAILDVAYKAGVVPNHLYGKTQQKTLQARLSEEILHHRETSPFYRTEPGQFFLTEFLDADDIPEEWKKPFPARRRTRDLTRDNTLAVKEAFLARWRRSRGDANAFFQAAEAEDAIAYMHPKDLKGRGYCSTWTFAMVVKDDMTLAYRVGRYRDDRDHFAKRRSIGFPGPLTVEDVTLFSRDHLGAEDSAAEVLMQDLDLSYTSFHGPGKRRPEIERVMVVEADKALDVVIVLKWNCPKWFEPTTRRMSLNEPHWLSTSIPHNDLDDFEPWSSMILAEWAAEAERETVGDQTHHTPAGGFSRIRAGE
ncbi:HTH domain-containing protein [Primorskyibacter flagellatus]|uniref:HB1, ASXL, restriction endonuclease HTH domain n=1 Tax=Primorskyibacter flagellatus TaxID=1387277 RepID=A0A1W1ZHI5_9RHOB|nr:HTH domain-containing protein [Primorskyibacter flagellatus]SMC47541.1 HB1, ASXL, restriction endonuclease HTH domain [Primorskyibacter flagellatus]